MILGFSAFMLAQLAKQQGQHFEMADGFAITLIAILFTVLAGFAAVAWWFHKRCQNPSLRDQVLTDLDQEPSQARQEKIKTSKATNTWERQGDWWKNS